MGKTCHQALVRNLGFLGPLCAWVIGCSPDPGISKSADAGGPGLVPQADAATPSKLELVQVTTVTTLQAPDGTFISPVPLRSVPKFVSQREATQDPDAAFTKDPAQLDLALLFQGGNTGGSAPVALDAKFSLPELAGGQGVWVQSVFPGTLTSEGDAASWPIFLHRSTPNASVATEYLEWTGWQTFGGWSIGTAQGGAEDVLAPAATLDLRMGAYSAPLVVTTDGVDVTIKNRSAQAFERMLLVYSHEGGIGVRVIDDLPELATVSVLLGPKEGPNYLQLQVAQERLTELFLEPLGDAIAPALARARSVPLLETQGLRVIALSRGVAGEGAEVSTGAVTTTTTIELIHAEVIEPKEADRVQTLLAGDEIAVADLAVVLGRFAEAKLELASRTSDSVVASRALNLLSQLRAR